MDTVLLGPPSAVRTQVADALERRQHHIATYMHPQALTLGPATAPDLIVVCHPEQDPCSWVRHIRAVNQNVLIMAVLSEVSPQHIHSLFCAGIDDCLLHTHYLSMLDTRINAIEQYRARSALRPTLNTPPTPELAQAVIADLSRRALSGTEMDVLMAYAAHVVRHIVQADACKVLEHQADQQTFLLRAGTGWTDVELGVHTIHERYNAVPSQALYTLQQNRPVVVENMDDVSNAFCLPPLLRNQQVRSGVCVAIASSPEPYGVLGVHAEAPRAYTSQEVFFLQAVANVLAGAVEQARTERALNVSEAKARAILETTVDGIITIDARGTIESFNAAAENIFGYSAHEAIGNNVKMLMPAPYRGEHNTYIQNYHDTGEKQIIGIGREVTGKRKDGSTFPMELAVSEVALDDRITFTGIVRDISERRRLEQEILSISEAERRRIGQDLHDGLGQMLTGIGLLHKNLSDQLQREEHAMASDAAEITDLIRDADQYARDLARGLTPVDLEASGLTEALNRLSDNAERLFDVHCRFEDVGTTLVHNSQAATHMYRITQEAVNNAVRHGEADRIRITLAGNEQQVRLRIRDDGAGFATEGITNGGMGLRIMKYRARIIGGSFDLNSAPGQGTTVTCTLPRSADQPTTIQ